MKRYEAFLEGLRLRHFAPHEVINYGSRVRGGAHNSLPPERLWPNLVPTLWIVDQLREFLGKPITLTSIYRNESYNRAVGGASGSYHMKNNAIDFQVKGVSPVQVFGYLDRFRDAGVFTGGLGKYATFVHVDTRGYNSTF